jgi:hypothetical protein
MPVTLITFTVTHLETAGQVTEWDVSPNMAWHPALMLYQILCNKNMSVFLKKIFCAIYFIVLKQTLHLWYTGCILRTYSSVVYLHTVTTLKKTNMLLQGIGCSLLVKTQASAPCARDCLMMHLK